MVLYHTLAARDNGLEGVIDDELTGQDWKFSVP